jgi:hypothetical protein
VIIRTILLGTNLDRLEGTGMEDVTIPGEPRPTGSALIRTLTLVASGLTVASVAVNIVLQLASHFQKRPTLPDQRTRLQTGQMTLKVLRQMPGLIKQTRLFVSQVKGAK